MNVVYKKSWLVNSNWYVPGPLKFPFNSGRSPATYFHGNKSIMPDIMNFSNSDSHRDTQTHAQRKYWSMCKFTEQNSGNKKKKKTELDLGFINMEGR